MKSGFQLLTRLATSNSLCPSEPKSPNTAKRAVVGVAGGPKRKDRNEGCQEAAAAVRPRAKKGKTRSMITRANLVMPLILLALGGACGRCCISGFSTKLASLRGDKQKARGISRCCKVWPGDDVANPIGV